jgi:hypothetical protein
MNQLFREIEGDESVKLGLGKMREDTALTD